MSQDNQLKFTPIGSKLNGVGGWLAFFIIGQLILRPIRTFTELNDPKNTFDPLFAEAFPRTVTLIHIENALSIALLVFGVVVALALWKIRTPFSVKLTKVYLIANAVVFLLDAFAIKLSDLPVDVQDAIMRETLTSSGVAIVVCVIWFLYFVKSERVKATYYGDPAALGLR